MNFIRGDDVRHLTQGFDFLGEIGRQSGRGMDHKFSARQTNQRHARGERHIKRPHAKTDFWAVDDPDLIGNRFNSIDGGVGKIPDQYILPMK